MDQYQKIITRYVNELNKRNYSVLDQVLNDEIIVEAINTTKEEYKKQIQDKIKLYPDYLVEIIDIKSIGDTVTLNWHRTGINNETGEQLDEKLISNYKLSNGKIYEVY
jgi:hypothetical protein